MKCLLICVAHTFQEPTKEKVNYSVLLSNANQPYFS